MSAKVTPMIKEQPVPLGRYVSTAVSASSDAETATDLLEQQANKNPALFRMLTGPFLRQACHDAVNHRFRLKRRQIWNQPSTGKRVLGHANLLMDFPLLDGTALRHAKSDQILDTAGFYETQASDMAFKSNWLRAIAKKLGRKTVEQVFDDAGLQKLQEKIRT